MTPDDYWRGNARLEHLTPIGQRFPEVGLFDALRQACRGSVFELGCGDGRLSAAFDPERYTGMDINPAALVRARQSNPGHRFTTEWQPADTVMAYTVLLHVPDDELPAMMRRLQAYPRIVIGEIMGRRWRTPGLPPVFNRERAEYEAFLGPAREVIQVPYPYYGTDLELCAW
ncbi:class I SAM-dependent methyltransferase [Halomonas sp. EGI 63088]|uniref:Class I SAM-dependent methyltransferase n=1 Tax=Halomonas flagellata TaxID=2920385 RepID=A0ABS9RU56_9GAMM|nr:class I SAM-dependent methyltransferase [Halomonas flagellata]MCH4563352.1 class I SAM-dependent methyltransferase [Halomonas flagellata]